MIASDRELAATRDTLSAYLEGDDDRSSCPSTSARPRPFRREVLETLHREVGPRRGRHLRRAGRAQRAPAGLPRRATACARNPVPIVVPCHRVLPSTGGIGNYGGGAERKRALLELEGAPQCPLARRHPDADDHGLGGLLVGVRRTTAIRSTTSWPAVTLPSSA